MTSGHTGLQCPNAGSATGLSLRLGGRWQDFCKGLVFSVGCRGGLFSSERARVRVAGPWDGQETLLSALFRDEV